MKKITNVTHSTELKAFAQASSVFREQVILACMRGTDECDSAVKDAEFFWFLAQKKVEETTRHLYAAERALNEYESQNHIDYEGNSTYDSSHAARLRNEVDDAQSLLNAAKSDEQNVLSRYQQVRQETDSLRSELSSVKQLATNASEIVFQLVNEAAGYIDEYKNLSKHYEL